MDQAIKDKENGYRDQQLHATENPQANTAK